MLEQTQPCQTLKNLVRYAYDAWGNHIYVQYGSGTTASSTAHASVNPFRYRGYFFDKDSGMYYLKSRWYVPELRRFLNADVFVSTNAVGLLSANMYTYCENDPVNMIDPEGTCPWHGTDSHDREMRMSQGCQGHGKGPGETRQATNVKSPQKSISDNVIVITKKLEINSSYYSTYPITYYAIVDINIKDKSIVAVNSAWLEANNPPLPFSYDLEIHSVKSQIDGGDVTVTYGYTIQGKFGVSIAGFVDISIPLQQKMHVTNYVVFSTGDVDLKVRDF